MNTNELLVHFTGSLNDSYEAALRDLNEEQSYFLPTPGSCHIAFHAWHFVRTQDNICNFVCQNRKAPVWIRRGLHEAWDLPKVAQGTGMTLQEARALRLPGVHPLIQYMRDVWVDIQPYLANATREDLQSITRVNPWGERPKLQHIGETVIAHGNRHLGQILTLRTLLGLPADSF